MRTVMGSAHVARLPAEVQDTPPKVSCPGRCGRTVHVDFVTDGHGRVVEVVPPCRVCRRSSWRAPEGHVLRTCAACGAPFSEPRRRGRPRAVCPRCKAAP